VLPVLLFIFGIRFALIVRLAWWRIFHCTTSKDFLQPIEWPTSFTCSV